MTWDTRDFWGGAQMNLQLKNLGRIGLLLLFIFSLNSQAAGQRVIVILKDKQTFTKAQQDLQQMKVSSVHNLNIQLPKNSLANVKAILTDSLSQLNAMVMIVKDDNELAQLQMNPNVALVEKEIFHPLPKPFRGSISNQIRPASFDMNAMPGLKTPWGIKAVNAIQSWPTANYGMSARVAVLDTGLDKNHPSIRSNFEKGKNFVTESGAAEDDIKDVVGHGTHTSGTIAGVADSTGFTGVAPKAKILSGKVCSEEGCSNVSIAQGINWAVQENVDVISMSLGGSMSTPSERMAIRSALNKGITIVAATGNDGVEQVSYPAALPGVIAVGAVDSHLTKAEFSQWGPEVAVVGPGVDVVSTVPQGAGRESQVRISINGQTTLVKSTTFEGAKEMIDPQENVLVDVGIGRPEDFAKVNVLGKFALVKRGDIKFVEKVENALNAGAAAVLIYNNQPGLLQGALTEDGSTLDIGVYMIEQSIGEQLLVNMTEGKNTKAILATIVTDYSSFDGTSMATPHVAGVAALIKATNKSLKPSQVKEILQTTATPLGPNEKNQYGSGLVNAEKAVELAKSKLDVNEVQVPSFR